MNSFGVLLEARMHTRRLLRMTTEESFAAAVEANRDHLLASPILEQLTRDAQAFGSEFVDDFLRQAADGWLADGLEPVIVRARILGIRQAIRKATDA